MQNKSILSILAVFLLVALASGLENRKSLRNRQLAKKVMEDMVTKVVETTEEADDVAEAEADADEIEADATGELVVCKTSCKKWEGNANKYDACIAECDGAEPDETEPGDDRRNRRLARGGIMGKPQDVAVVDTTQDVAVQTNGGDGDEDAGVDVADDVADQCELDCEQENFDDDEAEAACKEDCYGSRRNRRLARGGIMGKPQDVAVVDTTAQTNGNGDDSVEAENDRCNMKCTEKWGDGTEKEVECKKECDETYKVTGGRRRRRLVKGGSKIL